MDLESAAYTVDPSEVPPRPTILSNGIRMAAAYGHTGKWRLLDDFLGPRLVRVVIRCQRSDLDHRLVASPRTPMLSKSHSPRTRKPCSAAVPKLPTKAPRSMRCSPAKTLRSACSLNMNGHHEASSCEA